MTPQSETVSLLRGQPGKRNSPSKGNSRNSVDQRIRAFLNGEGHGEDVLRALYGRGDEPIPERLRRLLRD